MSVIDDIRKLLQDFIAPELRAIRGEIALVSERVKSFEEKTDLRFKNIEEKMDYRFHTLEEKMDLGFDRIMKELATDKRIERLEQLVAKQNENKDATQ